MYLNYSTNGSGGSGRGGGLGGLDTPPMRPKHRFFYYLIETKILALTLITIYYYSTMKGTLQFGKNLNSCIFYNSTM